MVATVAARRTGNRIAAIVAAVALSLTAALSVTPEARQATSELVSVIVQGITADDARTAVERHGGEVTYDLPIVDGVEARVPASAVPTLHADPAVRSVSPNAAVELQKQITPAHAPTDVYNELTGATALRASGVDGGGTTVAVIDSGIQADLPDLAGKVVGGVDFTTELDPYTDSFGHGTFVAGLIAGSGASSLGNYTGMAPGTRLLSVKIAGENGASDVSQLLKALQWTVLTKPLYGTDVVNLSVGTDSAQPYALSPLDRAVEEAWQAGIVVVVSASNLGQKGPGSITKPADDPFVITVGAIDDKGTRGRGDDQMAGFSGMGPTAADGISKPEVVASGRSVVSLRVPGSFIDSRYPEGRVGTSYFRGSGTSFSAAVVSGAAALLLDDEPGLNPNQVKARLMATAAPVSDGGENVSGAGSVNVAAAAASTSLAEANQGIPVSVGVGSVDADRGSLSVDIRTELVTDLVGNVLYNSEWTADPTGSNWWGSNWWGSNWWGSNWWGSNWWGSNWWGSNWWGSNWWGGWE